MESLNTIKQGDATTRDWVILAESYSKADASYGILLIRELKKVVEEKSISIENATRGLDDEDARVIEGMIKAER